MTKSLKDAIIERDQMYAEYVKDISLQFVERLSAAVSSVLFDGHEVSIIMEDIIIVPQNLNYLVIVMLVSKGPEKLEKDEVRMGNTVSFAIPINILEKGTASDIIEYLNALKDDQNAKGQPIPADTSDIEYAQRIIDRVNTKEREEKQAKKEQGLGEERIELDEIQKALIQFTQVTETKH